MQFFGDTRRWWQILLWHLPKLSRSPEAHENQAAATCALSSSEEVQVRWATRQVKFRFTFFFHCHLFAKPFTCYWMNHHSSFPLSGLAHSHHGLVFFACWLRLQLQRDNMFSWSSFFAPRSCIVDLIYTEACLTSNKVWYFIMPVL